MITCPTCGELTKDEICLYRAGLRRQTFAMLPILPTCQRCGADVTVTHTCTGGSILVLNGTCGSGKSTIAEILAERGYLAIDGDCVIQVVKHKTGSKQPALADLVPEVASELDLLSLYGDRFVLSHVITPDEMEAYVKLFRERNLAHRFILLKPEYQIAVVRCQSRTCHTSITPDYWIKHFHDLLAFDHGVEVVDNTHMTPEETAAYILSELGA